MTGSVRTLLLAAAACLALAPIHAFAHGKSVTSVPADGAVLTQAPERLEVRFDGAHRVTLMRLAPEQGAPVKLSVEEGLAPTERATAAAPELAPGAYRLEWRALAPDGHAIKGSAAFTYAPE